MHSQHLLNIFGPHQIMYFEFSVVMHQNMALDRLLNTGLGGCWELKSLATGHRLLVAA